MADLELRHWIYATLARHGSAPTRAAVAERVGEDRADDALRELHDAHLVVLADDGEIAMALPFANHPTGHRVIADHGSWWANCAWDSLALPAAMGCDARIDAVWTDTGEPIDLGVADGQLVGDTAGFVHFEVPARRWWDDIVET